MKYLPLILLLLTGDVATSQVFTLFDINPTGSSYPGDFAELNGKLYFRADDGTNGAELWVTDGTVAGTHLLKDFNPVTGYEGYPEGMILFKGKLFFSAIDAYFNHGRELWSTDGTEEGTVLIKDINTGTGNSDPNWFTIVGDKLYFSADDGVNGKEPWISDGTAEGTHLLKDINLGAGSSYPHTYKEYHSMLYFIAEDTLNNQEIWMTDGTESGTHLLKEIRPGSSGAFPDELTIFHDLLYFSAIDNIIGNEVWVSDGTEAGTHGLVDYIPGNWGIYPQYFCVFNDYLYFNGYTVTHIEDNELFRSDGTAAGTAVFKDLNPGTPSSNAQFMFPHGNQLYFAATSEIPGREPWVSDGTPEGTHMIKNINTTIYPGDINANPTYFFDFNGRVYFSAVDSTKKRTLWQTDGTEANTFEFHPVGGKGAIDVGYNIIYNGALYYSIKYFEESGYELWKIEDTSSVGTKPVLTNADIRIYPNPAHDQFVISGILAGEIGMVEILDIAGRKIYSGILKEDNTRINTSSWNTGIYLVKVQLGEYLISRKLLLE